MTVLYFFAEMSAFPNFGQAGFGVTLFLHYLLRATGVGSSVVPTAFTELCFDKREIHALPRLRHQVRLNKRGKGLKIAQDSRGDSVRQSGPIRKW